jgi:hypothetical protein
MKADGFPPNSYGIHTYYLAIRREREAHLTERAPAEYLQITAQDRPPVGLIEKLCLPAIANDRSRPVGARRYRHRPRSDDAAGDVEDSGQPYAGTDDGKRACCSVGSAPDSRDWVCHRKTKGLSATAISKFDWNEMYGHH